MKINLWKNSKIKIKIFETVSIKSVKNTKSKNFIHHQKLQNISSRNGGVLRNGKQGKTRRNWQIKRFKFYKR